jgi:hypothetical protein
MPDDKSKRSSQDRIRLAGGEGYEVDYFARKHGITHEQAQSLINQHGNDGKKLDAEAAKLRTNK